MKEEARILGRTQPLVSVLSIPGQVDKSLPGVLILNAGLVHHVGPNRWSVRLARRLAESGHVCVRFDHSGLGDTDPRRDALPAEQAVVQEISEVMEDMQRLHGIKQFVLMGLCSGASTAFLVARDDPRISAAVLINPPAGGNDQDTTQYALTEGWAKRYLTISLLDPNAWWRAVTGRIEYRRMIRVLTTRVMQRLRPPPGLNAQIRTAAEMFKQVGDRGTRFLLLFSARDKGMPLLLRMLEDPILSDLQKSQMLQHVTISGTDHTFGLQCSQEQLFDEVERFLKEPVTTRPNAAVTQHA